LLQLSLEPLGGLPPFRDCHSALVSWLKERSVSESCRAASSRARNPAEIRMLSCAPFLAASSLGGRPMRAIHGPLRGVFVMQLSAQSPCASQDGTVRVARVAKASLRRMTEKRLCNEPKRTQAGHTASRRLRRKPASTTRQCVGQSSRVRYWRCEEGKVG